MAGSSEVNVSASVDRCAMALGLAQPRSRRKAVTLTIRGAAQLQLQSEIS
jgi:hypothetical protein